MPRRAETPLSVLVEACVTSVEEAAAAARAGAHRLELCSRLDVGGITPSEALLRQVKEAVALPVFAMARPRAGSFVFTPEEVAVTVRQIHALREAGADGVVVGALTGSGDVDSGTLHRLVAAAGGLPVTFHRAFDELRDPVHALEELAGAGVARVLTSGGAPTARKGTPTLAAMVERSAGRVEILAGGTVRGDHVRALVAATGVREVHARAAAIPGVVEALRSPA